MSNCFNHDNRQHHLIVLHLAYFLSGFWHRMGHMIIIVPFFPNSIDFLLFTVSNKNFCFRAQILDLKANFLFYIYRYKVNLAVLGDVYRCSCYASKLRDDEWTSIYQRCTGLFYRSNGQNDNHYFYFYRHLGSHI